LHLPSYDHGLLGKMHARLQSMHDAFMTMKTKSKQEILADIFREMGTIVGGDQIMRETVDMIGALVQNAIEKVRSKKREAKRQANEEIEKIRSEMVSNENQLFTAKVE
jgi:hypothetical protein